MYKFVYKEHMFPLFTLACTCIIVYTYVHRPMIYTELMIKHIILIMYNKKKYLLLQGD